MTSYIIIMVTLHDNSCERREKPKLSSSCVAVEVQGLLSDRFDASSFSF